MGTVCYAISKYNSQKECIPMTKTPLHQFQTLAIQHKLSATAILLWQHIYFIGQAQHQYTDLCLRTADVTAALHITRNGLQKVRRTLVNAGLLQVHINHRQQVYYTLVLDGNMIDDDKTPVGDGSAVPLESITHFKEAQYVYPEKRNSV